MKRIQTLLLAIALVMVANSLWAQKALHEEGLYAQVNTNKGEILVALFYNEMPINVGNFIALAEGKMKGDLNAIYQKKHLYDGATFSRALEGYMVTSHNKVLGVDNKSLGYALPMELNDSLASLPNILCLSSNSGLNDGSQLLFVFKQIPFFAQASVPVGQIVQGIDIAKSLQKDDVIHDVKIIRVGKEAKRFNGSKVVKEEIKLSLVREEAYKNSEMQRATDELNSLLHHEDEVYRLFAKSKLEVMNNGDVLPSGVRIIKWKTTDGPLPQEGQYIWVGYVGYLPNGKVFDSSYDKSEAVRFTFGTDESIEAWNEVFKNIRLGEKATIIVPSSSAYGKEGAGRDIPPYTSIIFDITLEEIEDNN